MEARWVDLVLTGQVGNRQVRPGKRKGQQDAKEKDRCSHAVKGVTPVRGLGNSRFHG